MRTNLRFPYFRPNLLLLPSTWPLKMTSEDDYFSKLERKKLILSFVENGEWKRVLEYYDTDYKFREPLLVWIKPSLDLLIFIETCLLHNLGIEKVHNFSIKVCFGKKITRHAVIGQVWTNCLILSYDKIFLT